MFTVVARDAPRVSASGHHDMIDLHCHILPGIDDGARDLDVALDMARAHVNDGVTTVACTPHILPGLYHNSGAQIAVAVASLNRTLADTGIPLVLTTGADNHMVQNFVAGLASGHLLSLGGSRYVLVEPPHHVMPVRLDDLFFDLSVAGHVPILTHPERLTWIKGNYDAIQRLAGKGVWMQITAGSLSGAFGRGPQYWAERMLDDGLVHIIATDAHDMERRPPNLSEGRRLAAARVGEAEALHLVETRPRGVLDNADPASLPQPSSSVTAGRVLDAADRSDRRAVGIAGRLRRLFG